MYSNELLEEKYKAQRKLFECAETFQKGYMEYVEEEVVNLYKKKGWKLIYSQRKGGYSENTDQTSLFGNGKGLIIIKENFDDPIEDFNEYM